MELVVRMVLCWSHYIHSPSELTLSIGSLIPAWHWVCIHQVNQMNCLSGYGRLMTTAPWTWHKHKYYCCLQYFDAVGWAAGRASSLQKTECWDAGMVVFWVKVQICIWPIWCHCHLLSLAPVNRDWFYLAGFTFLVPVHLHSPGKNPRGP